jgi:NAD(P)-dependent dehydrogenase (short-subunit alcohol dehydrogenase family)
LEKTAAMLRGEGAKLSTHVVDLSSEAAVQEFAREISGKHDKLHVLMNNAAIAYGGVLTKFETLNQATWNKYMMVNCFAPLMLAQALRAPLTKAKGVILNMSSTGAWQPNRAYGVTKATLNAMTYAMAETFGQDGIRVNALAPGIMETPASVAGVPPEIYAQLQAGQMIKGHGTPVHIADLAVFLASDEASFITCQVIACDGGIKFKGWRS